MARPTIVFFHAHPDDEAIFTGGTMRLHATAFTTAGADVPADRLAAVLDDERADAFVTYDPDGIYGHPDHVHAHDVGLAACAAVGLASVYDVWPDRGAARPLSSGRDFGPCDRRHGKWMIAVVQVWRYRPCESCCWPRTMASTAVARRRCATRVMT